MKLTTERLRQLTLARQFPAVRGHGSTALLDLFGRLGPIQSQVPRAPFLFAASRLPGIKYATVAAAFADQQLLKASNLRGTVHTSTVDHFGWADAAVRPIRARDLARTLVIDPAVVEQLIAEIERLCGDLWQRRDDLVDQVRSWLRSTAPAAHTDELDRTGPAGLVWGHSGLIRRPHDDRWERRTDILHRTAGRVLPTASSVDLDQQRAVTELTRVHLSAYGPASRRDIAWWIGCPLGLVDRALAALGSEIEPLLGPDGEPLVDLADLPRRRGADPGVRLLPEFDGLLLGYSPANRCRFLEPQQLDRIWSRANGQFIGTVLQDGRIVAGWRTRPGRPATDTVIEVRPFEPGHQLDEATLDRPVGACAAAVGWTVSDVVILPSD